MKELIIHEHPRVKNPPMVLGLTGWMDGGRVSTGSIRYLKDNLAATKFAEINPLDFYIFNFPAATIPVSIYPDRGRAVVASLSPMEFAAVFRPHTEIEDGTIESLTYPENEFRYSVNSNLLLFSGEEPHIRWGAYCECIFALAEEFEVKQVYFIGSVASPIPHTREPRIRASVASAELKAQLADAGVEFTDYKGPASIITSLAHRAAGKGIEMRSLVVEVPHYPFLDMPAYPKSILKAISALSKLLHLDLSLADLYEAADTAEAKLNATAEENDDFKELVTKLEEAYDYEQSSADEDRLRRLIDGIDREGNGDQR